MHTSTLLPWVKKAASPCMLVTAYLIITCSLITHPAMAMTQEELASMEQVVAQGDFYYNQGNFGLACQYYQPVADQGHVETCYKMGLSLYKLNHQHCCEYLNVADQNNHACATSLLGTIAEKQGNIKEAFQKHTRAAGLNNPQSTYWLAARFLKGDKWAQDIQQGLILLCQSATQQYPTCLNQMKKWDIETHTTCQHAQAGLNHQFVYACLQYRGTFMKKNQQEALKFLKDLAATEPSSQLWLAKLHYNQGELQVAEDYFKKAIDNACLDALYEYGVILAEDRDSERSNQGIALLKQAESHNHPPAIERLTLMRQNGLKAAEID